jgi:acyl-CoA thioester hydrolase
MKQQPFEVALDLPIKTYDIDFAGIVSNIVYIRWLEDLRLKMLESYLPLEQLMAREHCPIINSTEIQYKKALRMFDRPVGKMWMSQLGRSRCTLQAEIFLGQEIAATATQVGFFMSLESMRPIAMPEELKHIYTEYD